MLSVIGLQVNFSTVSDIDAFDYHLYCNKPIALQTDSTMKQLVDGALVQISGAIKGCQLDASSLHLIVLEQQQSDNNDLSFYNCLVDRLDFNFASYSRSADLNHALVHAVAVCSKSTAFSNQSQQYELQHHKPLQAVIIISAETEKLDGIATVVVCDESELIEQKTSKKEKWSQCGQHLHAYATINACSLNDSNNCSSSQHISHFLSDHQLTIADIETVITDNSTIKLKRNDWLIAHENERSSLHCSYNSSKYAPSTLLTLVNLIGPVVDHFDGMLKLLASILCLDQGYRLGSDVEIIDSESSENDQTRWENGPYYYLSHSTSYLADKQDSQRNIIFSHHQKGYQQLVWLSGAENSAENVDNNLNEVDAVKVTESISNGFMAQQPLKPIIYSDSDIENLITTLSSQLRSLEKAASQPSTFTFFSYCEQQYLTFLASRNHECYRIVLLASSFEALAEQIRSAIVGIPHAINQNMPWKTPAGSYFSSQLCQSESSSVSSNSPLSFVYPGIGSLYVGMGKDLLRLFPESYSYITSISYDLSSSLQDHLITPRLLSKPSFEQVSQLEKALRHELANIAEAGVSYACLLTDVFQRQLNLKATSAAGYSMGEVSMFAAQGCWNDPTTLSSKIRASNIFTEQLSGLLLRLKSAWGINKQDFIHLDSKNELLWESFHIKAGVIQVEAVLQQYPKVYITIINTYESLVIAGDPSQCTALAKQLGVRAIALNVHNIIHCSLAKSEYENMKHLYSLPVNQSRGCKLFSSSCYLPVPVSENAIAVSIAKCLTEQVDFPRLINALNTSGETVFIEMGAGKSLGTWIERILKNASKQITCLSANQKNSDDYSVILKTIAPLISLGYPINLQSFFTGTLIRPVKRNTESVSVL